MTGPSDVASDVDRCRQCGQTVPDTMRIDGRTGLCSDCTAVISMTTN